MESARMNPGGSWQPSADVDETDLGAWYAKAGDHYLRYKFALEFCAGKSVVDIGCGHGFGARVLQPGVSSYLGVDVDEVAIAWAKDHIEHESSYTKFKQIDNLTSLLQLQKADVVVAFEVIEHVEDPARLLQVIRECTKPGGCAIISTPNGENSRGDPALYVSPFHVREYTREELEQLLRESGFQFTTYAEYRPDMLDVIGRVALRRPLSRRSTSSRPPEAKSLGSQAWSFWMNHLNGPRFWRISPFEGHRRRKFYSSIVAVLHPPGVRQ